MAELHLLDLALDRILPVEDGEAMQVYVRGRATLQPDLYRAGLVLLEAKGFTERDPEGRTEVIRELEDHPSIGLIVQHAIEGYYTSTAGYSAVGFRVTG